MPALITTGEKIKFLASVSQSERLFRITPEGDAVRLSQPNQLQILRTQISAGYKIQDHTLLEEWQIFAKATQLNQISGDTELGFGRELALFEDVQSFAWFQLTLPTGQSIYQITSPEQSPTGSGFYIPGVGLNFSTYWDNWDASSTFFLGHGFSRSFNGQVVTPGTQSFLQLAFGRNFKAWRVGFALEHQREEGKRIQLNGRSVDSYSWPLTLSLSYLHKSDIFTLSYMDETMIGPNRNTFLNHAISVAYIKRFF
jgi:hypothetical protein